jgi:hypothetical protein
MSSDKLRIAIIGDGIGGLTLALALRQRGLEPEIYEQATELAEIGAAVALSANSTRELTRLGLIDQLAAVSTEPSELIYRGWRTAERIASHKVSQTSVRSGGAASQGKESHGGTRAGEVVAAGPPGGQAPALSGQGQRKDAPADGSGHKADYPTLEVVAVAHDDHVNAGRTTGPTRDGVSVARRASPHIGAGRH